MNDKNIGLVIKAVGSLYTVKDLATGEVCDCLIRGKLRLKGVRTTNLLTVGDRVFYESNKTPVITDLEPRRNYIIRRSTNLSKEAHIVAANIDQAFLIFTLNFPRTSLEFVDRFLVSAEAYKIPVIIVINKMDLYDEAQLEEVKKVEEIYHKIGYSVVKTSIKQKNSIDNIKSLLTNKITLFSGNSGVGKSSLMNVLNPELEVRVGEISDYHNKGKHTTTFSEMFEVAPNTYIVDTPGIKGFGLVDIELEELYHFFPEIFAVSHNCKFANCTHVHEPDCAVRSAIEEGKVSGQRYTSYLKMLEGDEDEKYRK
jgi:ribosome biogenesis GTPase